MEMYCLKCKKKTETINITKAKSKNNKEMLKGNCTICGAKKSKFIPASSSKESPQGKTVQNNAELESFIKQLNEYGITINDLKKLIPVGRKLKKIGHGLFLGPFKNYEGGFLPLAALIPLITGILGAAGGVAGGIGSAVSSAKSAAEQQRHNREIEKMTKEQLGSGHGKKCKCGSGLFLGKP
jgi:hypothetical protein